MVTYQGCSLSLMDLMDASPVAGIMNRVRSTLE